MSSRCHYHHIIIGEQLPTVLSYLLWLAPGESFVILVSLLSALTEAPPNLGYPPFMQTNFLIFPSLNTTHIRYLPYSSVSSCSPVKRCMLALSPSLEHKFLDSQGQRIEAVRRLTFPLLYYLRIFTLCLCNLLK